MAQQKKEKEEIINEPQVTLIDRDSLIKRRYRQGVITTTMGRSFAIKSIDPKTMLLTRGSAFLPAFTDFISKSNKGIKSSIGLAFLPFQ